MKFTLAVPSALLVISSLVSAAPLTVSIKKRADPTPTDILQYALTLEHLENAFYAKALGDFDESAFEAANFPPWVRGRLSQISQHEGSHVKFLSDALGSAAVAPCEYNFPFNDPRSFLDLSLILEGVGTSAYLGAAKLLPDPTVLTAAGSILTTEARHDGWIGSAVLKGAPWSSSFDTPLTQNQVFTLASSFITSCPSTNAALPFTAFPPLTVTNTDALVAGQKISLDFKQPDSASGTQYLALFTGLSTLFAEINGNEATLPDGLQGVVYAVVSSNGTAVTDDSTVAGPAVLSFPFNSQASNP